jgi:hypothetical protein
MGLSQKTRPCLRSAIITLDVLLEECSELYRSPDQSERPFVRPLFLHMDLAAETAGVFNRWQDLPMWNMRQMPGGRKKLRLHLPEKSDLQTMSWFQYEQNSRSGGILQRH